MAIIDKRGVKDAVGRTVICLECETEFSIESENQYGLKKSDSQELEREGGKFKVACPECKATIYFN